MLGMMRTLRRKTSAQIMSVMPRISAQATSASASSTRPYTASSLCTLPDYLANTFFNCSPYCGLDLIAAAQPISFAFSTYALLVAASKLITWMPASACRLASFWL